MINSNLNNIFTNTVLLKVLEGKIQTGRLTQERNNVSPAKLKKRQRHTYTQTQTHTITTNNINKITSINNHWSLIILNVNSLTSPIKKTQTNKMDMKLESILLLHPRNAQHQG